MPNPQLLALLNLGSSEVAPRHEQESKAEMPVIDLQPIDGQNALKIQPSESIKTAAAENEHPYDVEARKSGWLALHSGEVYNAQISKDSHVFVVLSDNGTWEAWRETWRQGVLKSVSTKMIAKGVPFHVALQKATYYTNALTKYRS